MSQKTEKDDLAIVQREKDSKAMNHRIAHTYAYDNTGRQKLKPPTTSISVPVILQWTNFDSIKYYQGKE